MGWTDVDVGAIDATTAADTTTAAGAAAIATTQFKTVGVFSFRCFVTQQRIH